MKTGRRGFLGFMGGAAVAGPAAAKAAADKVLASAGVSSVGMGMPTPPMGGSAPGMLQNTVTQAEWASQQLTKFAKRRALAASVGIPESVLRALRDHANNTFALDVDLAAMVSMSPAAKIAHQRERNFQRQKEQLLQPAHWISLDLLTGQDEVWR